jgi:hypothetical protein
MHCSACLPCPLCVSFLGKVLVKFSSIIRNIFRVCAVHGSLLTVPNLFVLTLPLPLHSRTFSFVLLSIRLFPILH